MASLAEKAVLVQLNISQWTARKFDKGATELVAQQKNAASNAGRYNKALLPDNPYLSAVHKKTGGIRTMFYSNTLKWGIDGTQILPSKNYTDFVAKLSKEKTEWLYLVDEFIHNYDALRTNAQNFLGAMYNEAEYPGVSEVRAKFGIDLVVLPVPTNDFRVGLNAEEIDRLNKEAEQRVNTAATTAMKDVWQRLYDRVSNMAEKVGDMDNKFRSSTIDTLAELCGMLSKLNVLDDPNLEAMRQEVEARLTCYDRDDLVGNPVMRIAVAKEAEDIMSKMDAFMRAM